MELLVALGHPEVPHWHLAEPLEVLKLRWVTFILLIFLNGTTSPRYVVISRAFYIFWSALADSTWSQSDQLFVFIQNLTTSAFTGAPATRLGKQQPCAHRQLTIRPRQQRRWRSRPKSGWCRCVSSRHCRPAGHLGHWRCDQPLQSSLHAVC